MRHIALFVAIWAYALVVLFFMFQSWPWITVFFAASCLPFVIGTEREMEKLVRDMWLRKFSRAEKDFVKQFFEETKLPCPELYVIQNYNILNAFAFYWKSKRTVALSEELFRYGQRKFYGILAHEIAHFENNDFFFGPCLMYGYVLGGAGGMLLGAILAAQMFSSPIIILTLIFTWLFHVFTKYLLSYWHVLGQEIRADVLGVIFTKDVESHMEALLDLCMEKGMDGEGRKIMSERIRILASLRLPE
jgi:Zn-dependent protease with chaperone function